MEVQWSLVLFAALSALGAGAYAAVAVFGELMGMAPKAKRPCLILSAVALVVGALASMTHLGHLERIFGVLSNPASGIFVEGLSAGLLVVVIVVCLVAAARGASDKILKGLAVVGLVPAVVLTIAVGSSYLMPAKPAWDVAALPLLSVGTAAALGCTTYLALASRTASAAEKGRLAFACTAAILVQAVLLVLYVAMVAGAGYQDFSRSAGRMLAGDLAPLFWIGAVVLGVVVPISISIVEQRAAKKAAALGGGSTVSASGVVAPFAAVACLLLAAVAFRVIMFSMGSSIIAFGF